MQASVPRPWVFGNTTVRTALRLQDGLAALVTSGYLGIVEGENETGFARALDAAGVITLQANTTNVSSVARKWRGALTKLGFLTPKVTALMQSHIGPKFVVTPNGQRLLDAESVPAIQEVFLRAILAVQVPSPAEPKYSMTPFSPLRHTLAVMLELDRVAAPAHISPAHISPAHISPIEMAVVLQFSSSDDGAANVAARIVELRAARDQAVNKKLFDRTQTESVALASDLEAQTIWDYADTNFRYLKATGLVQNRGRGITIVPEKKVLAQAIVDQPEPTLPPLEYFQRLFDGAVLPTDDLRGALLVLHSLIAVATSRGLVTDVAGRDISSPAAVAVLRHDLEALISNSKEEDYAEAQLGQIDEILAVIDIIDRRSKQAVVFDTGEEVRVPVTEMPAYFEWVLWRVFLALRHYVDKPHEIRRFKVDQDFLPVGTAAGGGADVIVEFDEFVVVGEVTLTEGSRQEAAEGEPVRRHVAQVAERYAATGKPVYGLFIAKTIDSNTAETFRIGVWYRSDDSRMTVDVVPLTLKQFHSLVREIFTTGTPHPNRVREALDAITGMRHETTGAPEWKAMIVASSPWSVSAD